MKLKNVNYIAWILLFAELVYFGLPKWETFAVGALLLFLVGLRYKTKTSVRWVEAKLEFEKANPIPSILFDPVLLLFTLTALVLPFFSGVIILPLYLFVGLIWLVR